MRQRKDLTVFYEMWGEWIRKAYDEAGAIRIINDDRT